MSRPQSLLPGAPRSSPRREELPLRPQSYPTWTDTSLKACSTTLLSMAASYTTGTFTRFREPVLRSTSLGPPASPSPLTRGSRPALASEGPRPTRRTLRGLLSEPPAWDVQRMLRLVRAIDSEPNAAGGMWGRQDRPTPIGGTHRASGSGACHPLQRDSKWRDRWFRDQIALLTRRYSRKVCLDTSH